MATRPPGGVAEPGGPGPTTRRSRADGTAKRRLPLTGNSTPDRLRRVGALLVLGCVVTAVVAAVSGYDRSQAVIESDTRIAALASDAAGLFQSLADADATATSGYVSGRRESPEGRARYDGDVQRAAERLVHAASLLPEGHPATVPVTTLTTQLPVYTGLMETARTYNRSGLPLGQSYLTQASRLMQQTMLPAAAELRALETAELSEAYRRGSALPLAVLLLGLGLLVAVLDVANGERSRTNRLLNPGLVLGGLAVLAALVWWGLATVRTGSALDDASRHTEAVTALDDARTAVLKARSNESLVLVARGGGSGDRTFAGLTEPVAGPDGRGGLLGAAQAGGADVAAVRAAARNWFEAHGQVRALDDSGRFQEAVESVIGTGPSTSGGRFAALDDALAQVISVERDAIVTDVARARDAQALLAVVPPALLLLAGLAIAVGIAQRTAEYR
ncbi:hypothetical protein [Pseudonocardia humida]|uniref:Secreted protein n=1 Tax=Pseudonocardia humida TaxID=2800819 RepID=A0ABT1A3B2_9PSEU|nr:hypothetical protein [Pseudonocardia humida]MCO1657480.1 hypothetical protein [Pseudonocardia humida]